MGSAKLRHWVGGSLASLALFALAAESSAHTVGRSTLKAHSRINTVQNSNRVASMPGGQQLATSILERVSIYKLSLPNALDILHKSDEQPSGDQLARTIRKSPKRWTWNDYRSKKKKKKKPPSKKKKKKTKASPSKTKKKKKKGG